MSDNVTRYELEQGRSHDSAALMKADRMGDYVLYTDHAPVEAERDRLRAHVRALEAIAEAARRLDKLIGGKQLAQIGVETAKACVGEKRIIQDGLDAVAATFTTKDP